MKTYADMMTRTEMFNTHISTSFLSTFLRLNTSRPREVNTHISCFTP